MYLSSEWPGLMVVSEEEKKSSIDVIPKSLHYSTESMLLGLLR